MEEAEKTFDAMAEWARIKTRAANVWTDSGERRTLFEKQEKIFFMELDDEERIKKMQKGAKVVKSPDGRNQGLGAMRLLRVGEATWSIPREKNDQEAKDMSEPLEQFATQMYNAASRVTGVAPHEDGATSLILYDEIHVAVISTQELVAHAKKKSRAHQARAERVAARTPYLFEVWNAKDCCAVFDGLGLAAHYRRTSTKASEVAAEWGTEQLGADYDPTENYTLCEWWDLETHAVWLEEGEGYLLCDQHGLAFIPIVVGIGEGSARLFSDAAKQRQPFLYTYQQSGLFEMQSLVYSVMATQTFGLGANPMFLRKARDEDEPMDIDWNIPGGVATIGTDESFGQVQVKPINQDLQYLQNLLDEKGVESTMYRQALGESAGSGQAFSSLALLSQSGRLPLAGPKKRLGWVLGQAMQIAFAWMKDESTEAGKRKAKYGSKLAEIEIGKIPDDFEIECNVDVSLPQDKLQQVNIAKSATEAPQGQEPLASKRWAREEVLGIEQSSEMTKEIWREQAGAELFWQYVAMMQAMEAQRKQALAQAPGTNPMMGTGVPMAGADDAIGPDGSLPAERMMGLDDGLPPDMAMGPGGMPMA